MASLVNERSFVYTNGQIHFYERPLAPPQILQVIVKESLSWWDSLMGRSFKAIELPLAGYPTVAKSVFVDVSGTDFEKISEDSGLLDNLTILKNCTIPPQLLTPVTPVISKDYVAVDLPSETHTSEESHPHAVVVVEPSLAPGTLEKITATTVSTGDPSATPEDDGFVLVDTFQLKPIAEDRPK